MAAVTFRLLGPVEACGEDGPLPLGRRQQRAVLAILLLNLNRVVLTDQLVELLWPEAPPGRPQTAIQGHVSALRRLLGRDVIVTRGGGYALETEPELLDSERFARLSSEAEKALTDGEARRAKDQLETALALWHGPALADFAYEQWAQQPIGRLEEGRLLARENLLEARLALAEHASVLGDVEALVAEHPLRERPRRLLMLALFRAGRQADALDAFQRARDQLRDELGLDPSHELQALHRQILNQDQTLVVEPPRQRPPTNLPASPNAFIGRRREVEETQALLKRDDVRLVTLTGAGGSGKTRLALEVAAHSLEDFTGGVFFVALAPVREPGAVAPAIGHSLGLRDVDGVETLAARFSEKDVLLVLDNFEHVVEAATEVERLLAQAPRLTVLVTSRERLRITSEHAYPVAPLQVPDVGDDPAALARNDAVALFETRARAATGEFALTEDNAAAVAAICGRVDGLPLAIELAAARTSLFPPHALRERLDQRLPMLTGGARDADERHQTLHATIDWSYGLLTADEGTLFARIAVFVGGCRFDAADAVCRDDGLESADLIEGLDSLVEKNLLRRRLDEDGEPRFWMFETIREFALEQVDQASTVHERFARYFLELVREASKELTGATQQRELARLDAEEPNINAALATFAKSRDSAELELIASLWRHLYARGRMHEGLRLAEAALDRHPAIEPDLHARLLVIAGIFAYFIGDLDRAQRLSETALAIGRSDAVARARIPDALNNLGNVAVARGSFAEAATFFEEALPLASEGAPDRAASTGDVLMNLGQATFLLGDEARATELLEQALAAFRADEDATGVAQTLNSLAENDFMAGAYDSCAVRTHEALRLSRDLRNSTQLAWALARIVALELVNDKPALPELAEALGTSIEAGEGRMLVALLDYAGATHAVLGSYDEAALHWGAAAAEREVAGVPQDVSERQTVERYEPRVRAVLGDGYELRYAEGHARPLDDAARRALELVRALVDGSNAVRLEVPPPGLR